MRESIECISLNLIKPPHKVDLSECRTLIGNMKKVGWKGRPLLVVEEKDGTFQALTGSHRIFSARKAKLRKIPCVVIRNPVTRKIYSKWLRDGMMFTGYRKISDKLRKQRLYLSAILFEQDI